MPIVLNTSYRFRGQSLVGQRFGRLTVTSFAGVHTPGKVRYYYWLCHCDCGKDKTISAQNLKATGPSAIKSCGCLNSEVTTRRNFKHGLATRNNSHPLYVTWRGMRDRCRDESGINYKSYKAKGISISPEWDDFSQFVADMEPTWKRGLEIDRRDNSKGYSKENCRWATRIEQMNNMGRNHFVDFKGERLTMSQWARRFNIRPMQLSQRIRKGWDFGKAISEPFKQYKKKRTNEHTAPAAVNRQVDFSY